MDNTKELDFASLPPIFIIPANLQAEDLHEAEDAIYEHAGQLSYQPKEARIFLGRVGQKKRAAFELRSRGVWTEEVALVKEHVRKKRKLNSSDVKVSVSGSETESESGADSSKAPSSTTLLSSLDDHVIVLKLEWLYMSISAGHFLPFQPYQVYYGQIIDKPVAEPSVTSSPTQTITLIKATPDPPGTQTQSTPHTPRNQGSSITSILNNTSLTMKLSPRRFRDQHHGRGTPPPTLLPTYPRLHRTTTSEHDFLSERLPPPPPWLTERHPRPNYACLRSTHANPPNAPFLAHLHKIKEARILTLDEIGVRAYSSAIASLSAYPHQISSPAEITRLPGCSEKIAALWYEWHNSSPDDPTQRTLSITEALDHDEDLKHLRLFYDIWGVGAETARKFYYEHGWKDMDDVIEFGWNNALSRVQQIGVKFYDEFKLKIPRSEVESISDTILHHARICKGIPKPHWSNKENEYRGNWSKPDDGHGDPNWDARDMVCVIVGGYRRGKKECGDVDVILSHRDEHMTKDLVTAILRSLEKSGHVTHTLTLHTTNSDRDQQTLPYKGMGHSGHGFDTLDKALCVWQEPEFDVATATEVDRDGKPKNPNVHRRVDIIVSPWRTVGAAVLGWSGATTFERDVRVWCRKERGWKFDSSGVRDRGSGAVLDLESVKPRQETVKGKEKAVVVEDDGDSWEDRERRIMEGLGIGWRPATERCTG